MRKWTVIIVVILLVLGGAFAVALVNLNSYLNRNRDWLSGQVEAALGREVEFDEVGISMAGGLGARVKNLRIADSTAFSKEDFVRAGDVQILVKVFPALFGRYEVKRIVLGSPKVLVIRDEKGFNFESIGKKGEVIKGKAETEKEETLPEDQNTAESMPILVSLLEINDGEIHFIDRTAESTADLMIQKLDFLASDVSLTTPIGLHVAAALFGINKQNFELDVTLGPIGTSLDIQNIPINGKIELDPLDIGELRRALPAATEQIPPGLGLSGPIKVSARFAGSPAKLSVSDLSFAASIFDSIKDNFKISGMVGPIGATVPLSDIKLDLQVELGSIVIDKIKTIAVLAEVLPPELSSPDPIHLSTELEGDMENLAVKVELDSTDAAVRYGSVFVKPKDVPMKLELGLHRSGTSLSVNSLMLRLADLALSGKGTVVAGAETSFDFQIDSNRAPLDGWDRLFPALADQKVSGVFEVHLNAKGQVGGEEFPHLMGTLALQNVNALVENWPHPIEGLSTLINFKGDSLVIPPTQFKFGGSPVQIEAELENFKTPTVTFIFQSSKLHGASVGVAGEGVKKEEVIRGLEVRGILQTAGENPNFQGTVRSSSGSMRDIDYQELQADLRLQDQMVILDKLTIQAFDGTYNGGGRYDMRESENPKFDFKSTVRDMLLKDILSTQFPGAEKHIEGRLDTDIALTGSGGDWDTIQKVLRGQGRIEIMDGALKDVNIVEGALSGVTGIRGLSGLISHRVSEKYPELFGADDTRFDVLSGTVQISGGLARTNDLTISARDYTIIGKGIFAFENLLDFTATLSASQKLTDDLVSDVKGAEYITDEQGRLSIPFRMAGALPEVKPKPDTKFIAKALKRGLVKGGIEKLFGGKKKSGEESEEQKKPSFKEIIKDLEGIFGR